MCVIVIPRSPVVVYIEEGCSTGLRCTMPVPEPEYGAHAWTACTTARPSEHTTALRGNRSYAMMR